MRIGIVSDTFLPQIGGAEIHVKNLAHFLKTSGEDVCIFTNTPGDYDFEGIKVWRNQNRGIRLFRLIRDMKNLINFIGKVDCVHAHYTFYLSCLAVFICKSYRKPIVVTLHGLGTLDSSVDKYFRRRIYRWVSFKLADAVIATSDEMADVARRFVKEKKIFIITNGVDTNYFHSTERVDKLGNQIIVLSMRRLNPKNGVQYLIEAIPYVAEKFKNIEFWIFGKDKLEGYLRKRVEELHIGSFVKFIGNVPNDQIKEYYEKADIITFPSSAESTSIACLEAMSMEKCVVASALGVFKMMLGNNERGWLVKLFDREESNYDAPLNLPNEKIKLLADSVILLIKDDNLRKTLGKNAREYVVENYDWRILTKIILNIYKNL